MRIVQERVLAAGSKGDLLVGLGVPRGVINDEHSVAIDGSNGGTVSDPFDFSGIVSDAKQTLFDVVG